MEYTNIIQLANKFYSEFKWTLESNSLIGKTEWDLLLESLGSLIDGLSDPIVNQTLDNYKVQKQNPVERLGMVDTIIELTEEGKSAREISNLLQTQGLAITSKDVTSFLVSYDEIPVSSKIEKSNASIFDTQSQLQLLLEEITNNMEEMERLSDDEIRAARTTRPTEKLKAIQEWRMLVKDAAQLAEAVASLQSMEVFKKTVIEEINKADPRVAQAIYKRLQQAKQLVNALSL